MQTTTFTLPGMNTEALAQRAAAAISDIEGVHAIKLSLHGQKTAITYDDSLTTSDVLSTKLREAGFDVVAGGACCGGCCGS